MGKTFALVRRRLATQLAASERGRAIASALAKQAAFLAAVLEKKDAAVASKRDSVATKIEKLRKMLGDDAALLDAGAGIVMPTDTGILVCGVLPGEATMFKSALYPTAIPFRVSPLSTRVDWTGATRAPCGLNIAPAARAAALEAAGGATPDASAGSAVAASPAGGGRTGVGGTGRAQGGRENSFRSAPPAAQSDAAAYPSRVVSEAFSAAAVAGVTAASYKLIFKSGDDMRQDQLVIQMVRLMDGQLKRLGLDLRLTPYSVIVMGEKKGVMEMVLDSFPISHVVERYGRSGKGAARGNPILSFFQEHSPAPAEPLGIVPHVMDTYVKSAAGYCVITYLLGIGDRHLDNIMLRKDGHFFHIDFGFIFGRDPKPFPPPMRLTVEMIQGMGGYESPNYACETV